MTEEDFLEEVHRGTVPYAAAQKDRRGNCITNSAKC